MGMSERDIAHVFERLRSGVVPERGLETFAVGIDKKRAEIHRLLKMAEEGEGVFKFLRGGYGCGKTFMARLAAIDAQPLATLCQPTGHWLAATQRQLRSTASWCMACA